MHPSLRVASVEQITAQLERARVAQIEAEATAAREPDDLALKLAAIKARSTAFALSERLVHAKAEPGWQATLDAMVLDVVEDTYANYHRAKQYEPRRPEPRLSLGAIKGHLDTAHPPQAYRFAGTQDRLQMVQSSLTRLKRQGKLDTSWGEGVSGRAREVKLYEPARTR